jgi:hypothetical protein
MRTNESHRPIRLDPMTNETPGDESPGTAEAALLDMAHTDREGTGPVGGGGDAAEGLWDALAKARAEYAPQLLAATEDAVVRFYLPLARRLASAVAPRGLDHLEAEHAAVVALTHAVLAWQDAAREGFDAFARAAISSQLRFLAAAENQIWPDRSQGGTQSAVGAAPSAAPTPPATDSPTPVGKSG